MKEGKIIIAGTGRAGTSFLVVLLTRLGFNTGYKPYIEDFNENIMAGCEHKIFSPKTTRQQNLLNNSPRILKHPKFSLKLAKLLTKKLIKVDHIIIPVRDLKQAARSRDKVRRPWKVKGIEPGEKTLGYILGKAIETAVIFDIPFTLLHYPRLIEDENYCYSQLNKIFKLDRLRFKKIYQQLATPSGARGLTKHHSSSTKLIKPKIGILHKILYKLF